MVYGHGVSQPLEISPPLLAAWGGRIVGFNIARWVHSLSANAKKMMAVMENDTKLVRANKLVLDTVMYKVGEDAISDAFGRAADAADNTQAEHLRSMSHMSQMSQMSLKLSHLRSHLSLRWCSSSRHCKRSSPCRIRNRRLRGRSRPS